MIRVNFLALLFVLSSLLSGCSSKLTVMSNYYSLKSNYLQQDARGLDVFSVSSSGSTLGEFRENAKSFLIKQLIYDGFIQHGVVVAPVLTNPELQEKFKANEAVFLSRLFSSNGLIKQLDLEKGRKVEGSTLYQLRISLVVDRSKLELETQKLLENL